MTSRRLRYAYREKQRSDFGEDEPKRHRGMRKPVEVGTLRGMQMPRLVSRRNSLTWLSWRGWFFFQRIEAHSGGVSHRGWGLWVSMWSIGQCRIGRSVGRVGCSTKYSVCSQGWAGSARLNVIVKERSLDSPNMRYYCRYAQMNCLVLLGCW